MLIDFQKYNPFRTPQWRWERAERLAAHQENRRRRRLPPEDALVLCAAEHQKTLANATTSGLVEAAQRRWPAIALAHAFFNENRATRWMIEAYLLAGLSASRHASPATASPTPGPAGRTCRAATA